jgi:hypothetical protein
VLPAITLRTLAPLTAARDAWLPLLKPAPLTVCVLLKATMPLPLSEVRLALPLPMARVLEPPRSVVVLARSVGVYA